MKDYIPETTKIIIAQRTASVEDADRIIVMEGGEINAIGTMRSCWHPMKYTGRSILPRIRRGTSLENKKKNIVGRLFKNHAWFLSGDAAGDDCLYCI